MTRFAITAVSDKVETPLKQRLVGATVLVALGVIFIPMLLEGGKDDARLTVSMEIPPQPRLEFEDRLETSPQTVTVDEQPLQPLKEAIAPVKQQHSPPTATKAPSSQSPGPVVKEAPKAEKAVSSEVTKDAAGDNRGQWVVQAGSFSRETNAIVLRDQLKTNGFKAFVENASTGAGSVYRVRIGPMEERDAAEALVKRLNSSGNYHGMVMSYP